MYSHILEDEDWSKKNRTLGRIGNRVDRVLVFGCGWKKVWIFSLKLKLRFKSH